MLSIAGFLACMASGVAAQDGSGKSSPQVVAQKSGQTPRNVTGFGGSMFFGYPAPSGGGTGWMLTIPEGSMLAGFGGVLVRRLTIEGRIEPGYVRAPRVPGYFWHTRNPVGTFTVNGDFRQTAEGTLVIDVKSRSRHDLLIVEGTASLSGNLRIDSLGYRPRAGDRIPILKARKIIGSFTEVRSSIPGRYEMEFVKLGGSGFLFVVDPSQTGSLSQYPPVPPKGSGLRPN